MFTRNKAWEVLGKLDDVYRDNAVVGADVLDEGLSSLPLVRNHLMDFAQQHKLCDETEVRAKNSASNVKEFYNALYAGHTGGKAGFLKDLHHDLHVTLDRRLRDAKATKATKKTRFLKHFKKRATSWMVAWTVCKLVTLAGVGAGTTTKLRRGTKSVVKLDPRIARKVRAVPRRTRAS